MWIIYLLDFGYTSTKQFAKSIQQRKWSAVKDEQLELTLLGVRPMLAGACIFTMMSAIIWKWVSLSTFLSIHVAITCFAVQIELSQVDTVGKQSSFVNLALSVFSKPELLVY